MAKSYVTALVLAGFSLTASAQLTCTASGGTPVLARAEGDTEPLSDIVIVCTGGTPTLAGDYVPQISFEIVLNTNLTSKVTYGSTFNFSEGLMLIDEPNQPNAAGAVHPLLNCGQTGAPDNGLPGPGICEITSTGFPTQTYDGTPSVGGSACYGIGILLIYTNVYGCGRPNAFQGQMGAENNVIDFLGVPLDPPGAGTRTIRITNLRADAAVFGGVFAPINALVALYGDLTIILMSPQVTIGYAEQGLVAGLAPGTTQTVRVTEGFASSFKYRNIGNTLANASWSGTNWVYVSPDQNDPAQAAQNVPGIIYNTEDGFQWQNNAANAPPSPNPPLGYQMGGTTSNLDYPLNSVAYGGVNTGINADGVSSAGTRIALTFRTIGASTKYVPPTVTVPSFVYLHPVGSPATTSGVMVLTSTDSNGAGPFTPGASTTIPNGGTAVYEVLYSDPFSIEYGDIDCAVTTPPWGTEVTVNFAPFYSTPGAAFATPTIAHPSPTAVPRFSTAYSTSVTIKSGS